MTAIARTLSRVTGNDIGAESLMQVVLFCAAGLFVSLLCATSGLDVSRGFF